MYVIFTLSEKTATMTPMFLHVLQEGLDYLPLAIYIKNILQISFYLEVIVGSQEVAKKKKKKSDPWELYLTPPSTSTMVVSYKFIVTAWM